MNLALSPTQRLIQLTTVFAALFAAELGEAASQPNVIVIVSDDAGYNDLGFSAALTGTPTTAVTPHLDALAQQSVVVSQGYAAPVCSPTRVGLLTGVYQQKQGVERVLGNDLSETWGLDPSIPTVADRMKSLGYTTGAIGKWHVGYQDGINRPNDVGFDEYFGFLSGNRHYFSEGAVVNQMLRNDTNVEAQWRTEGDHSLYETTGAARGRYVTDAFGEESADFINRHANDAEPFFLYSAFSAPHDIYDSKQQDYDLFANISDPNKRTDAAMVYALDRAVGMITDAVDNAGIADNTVIIFINDNGAPGDGYHDNSPFRGFKATTWEGGIRVPYFIKAPGVTPGVYNSPVSMYDIAATSVAIGGGAIPANETDGVNLLPYLTGANTSAPHESISFRSATAWAIRKGDWKLGRMQGGGLALYNISADPTESTNLVNSQAAIVDELTKDFTRWEATVKKPEYGSLGADDRNRFDRFVFRSDLASTANWNTANQWFQGGTTAAKTMLAEDGYANAILEFNPNNSADYVANNNMLRQSALTYMLNRIELKGTYSAAANHSATLTGNALLVVKNLSGGAPTIQVDTTKSSTGTFTYNINNELQLLDDLVFDGNGSAPLFVGGVIKDYDGARGIIKNGSSVVTLTGANTFKGAATVNAGELRIQGASAAINGAASVAVAPGAKLTLASGSIRTNQLSLPAGSQFAFTGGRLDTPQVTGDLNVAGGVFGGNAGGGASIVTGDLTVNQGAVEIELTKNGGGGEFSDQIVATGAISLGNSSQLIVALADIGNGFAVPSLGDSFTILSANAGINGTFGSLVLPTISSSLSWLVQYSPTAATLSVVAAPSGDFNNDGFVNATDLSIWKANYGLQSGAAQSQGDANHDGRVNGTDFLAWQRLKTTPATTNFAAVPEPSGVALGVAAITFLAGMVDRTRSRQVRD